MEEEILDQEENNEIPTVKILTKREGNKLLVANAGCRSLIGIIECIEGCYFIQEYPTPFKSERNALDYLLS